MTDKPRNVGKGLPPERFTQQRDEASREGVRGLLLINGGGAVALLAFLQAVWSQDEDLAKVVVEGLAAFCIGVAVAGLASFLRYHTSFNFQEGNMKRFWWFRRGYIGCWYLSLASFVVGVIILVHGAWRLLSV